MNPINDIYFHPLQLEKVRVTVQMPSEVSSVNVTPSLGKSTFDTVTKTLTWDVGHLEPLTYPSLKGTVGSIVPFVCLLNIMVNFRSLVLLYKLHYGY